MTTQTPSPVVQILPETVRKVTIGNSFHYGCKALVTLNDGKTLEFAIKTKRESYQAEAVFIKIDGTYVPAQPSDLMQILTSQFFVFLAIMDKCFGTKARDGRNKLFLTDRLLKDETPTTARMKYSSMITQSICLVGGKLVRMKHGDFFEDATYFEQPLDLSSDWAVVENPSQAFCQAVENAQSFYKSGMAKSSRQSYHKEQVKRGVRM